VLSVGGVVVGVGVVVVSSSGRAGRIGRATRVAPSPTVLLGLLSKTVLLPEGSVLLLLQSTLPLLQSMLLLLQSMLLLLKSTLLLLPPALTLPPPPLMTLPPLPSLLL